MKLFLSIFSAWLILNPLSSEAQNSSGQKCILKDFDLSSGKLIETGKYITLSKPGVGDIDGDKKNDLAFVALGQDYSTKIIYLKNAGDANFTPSKILLDRVSNGQVEIADLNGDSRADVVHSNFSGIRVLINQGGESFSQERKFAHSIANEDVTPVGMILANFNNDDLKDIAVLYTSYQSNNKAYISIFDNKGDGNFSSTKSYLIHEGAPGSASGVFQIVSLDLNRDNAMELVTNNLFSNKLPILNNDGFGNFTVSYLKTGNSQGSGGYIGIQDINDDALPDILAGESPINADPGFHKLINTGTGKLIKTGYQSLQGIFRLVRDIDNDRVPEYFFEPEGINYPPLTTEFSSSKKKWGKELMIEKIKLDRVNSDSFLDIVGSFYDRESGKLSIAIYESDPQCKSLEILDY